MLGKRLGKVDSKRMLLLYFKYSRASSYMFTVDINIHNDYINKNTNNRPLIIITECIFLCTSIMVNAGIS